MRASYYKNRLKSELKCLYNWLRQRPPLVSVIITCYNHGRFLSYAIESVLKQTWEPWSPLAQRWSPIEVIVVDDGSTDTTRVVSEQYGRVRYVYQTNQGLSAARNTGVQKSHGEFIVFLDADDWLYPDALHKDIVVMDHHPNVAFVSGGHDKVDSNKQVLSSESRTIETNHYQQLLKGNYIGMHATVMYRRSVFDTFVFDTSLKVCEDYDLYLRIAREQPVAHHPHRIAAYRIHNQNMSANIAMMLSGVLDVLSRQEPNLRDDSEREAYRQGRQIWTDYYEDQLNRIQLK